MSTLEGDRFSIAARCMEEEVSDFRCSLSRLYERVRMDLEDIAPQLAVLVICADKPNRQRIASRLSDDLDVPVFEASSSKQAEAIYRRNHPMAVVADISLGGETSLMAIDSMRSPSVVITSTSIEPMLDSVAARLNAIPVKPTPDSESYLTNISKAVRGCLWKFNA
jgi:CheY-like chemotaxis protein